MDTWHYPIVITNWHIYESYSLPQLKVYLKTDSLPQQKVHSKSDSEEAIQESYNA